MTIRERGNSDGFTLTGEPCEDVHYMVGPAESSDPACKSGAWNMLYTRHIWRVTCERCKARLAE